MRATLLMATVALLLAVPVGAQFVAPGGAIPVVANNPGLNGTYWRSDVSILNTDDEDTKVVMMLFPELVNGVPAFDLIVSDEIDLPAAQQVVFSNVVQSKFGLLNKKGALSIISTTGSGLVISSRVYTVGDQDCAGSYGQDVNSVLVKGDAWAVGIEHDGFYRSNLGVFMPVNPVEGESLVVTVNIFESDGELAGSGTLAFAQAGLQQRNFSEFGVENLFSGYVTLHCSDSSLGWYAYVSTVDETSGDAVFRIARGIQPN